MQNLPEWVQAICAFATLILAIIIYFQGKKIKTLTDVVESLNHQVKIAQELLSFEIKSRINEAQPNFSTGMLNKSESNNYTLSLLNRGLRARNVHLETISNINFLKKIKDDNSSIENNFGLQLNFKVKNTSEQFKFKIKFEDDYSNLFEQIITGFNDRVKITISKEFSL